MGNKCYENNKGNNEKNKWKKKIDDKNKRSNELEKNSKKLKDLDQNIIEKMKSLFKNIDVQNVLKN